MQFSIFLVLILLKQYNFIKIIVIYRNDGQIALKGESDFKLETHSKTSSRELQLTPLILSVARREIVALTSNYRTVRERAFNLNPVHPSISFTRAVTILFHRRLGFTQSREYGRLGNADKVSRRQFHAAVRTLFLR